MHFEHYYNHKQGRTAGNVLFYDAFNTFAFTVIWRQIYGSEKETRNSHCKDYFWEVGNGINVSISINGSDTPVTRPETDKAGQSSRDRKMGGGKF